MKRSLGFVLFLLVLFCLSFVVGCSSAPEAPPQESVPATEPKVDEAALAAEQAAAAKAAEQAAAAKAAELAAQTERLMAELTAAKDAAQAAGADSTFPEEFTKVSGDYEALIQSQMADPSKDYRSQIENLRDAYLALEKLTKAQDMRNRIKDAGLEDYDVATLQKGDQAMEQAKTLHNQGAAGGQLLEQATIAYDSFFSIMDANYATLCETQRELALAAKEKADSIKAAMAAKAEYDVAAQILATAESAYTGKDYGTAYDGFVEATSAFNTIYNDVFAKRSAAEEAIRRAKQKVAASAEIAAEADEIAPLQPEEDSVDEGNNLNEPLSEENQEVAQ